MSRLKNKVDKLYADRAYDMAGTVKTVVSFFIVALIAIIILSQFWSVIGTGATEVTATLEDDTGANLGSGETVEIYNASDDTLIASDTTDSNGTVSYTGVDADNVYLQYNGTTSSNQTLDYENVDLTWDYVGNTLTVDSQSDGAFAPVKDQMESMINSVFGLIVLLPLILVAVVAYRMISTKL